MSEHEHEHEHEDDHGHDHDHAEDEQDREERAERQARRQLALSQVRQYGDPVLRMRANEVDVFDDELVQLSERMIAVMHDADGVGLAATQVGILRRLFVFHDEDEDRVVINPVLTVRGGETEVDEEGCLSLGPVRMPVKRAVEVTLDGVSVPAPTVDEVSPSDLLSAELDHLSRDRVYEASAAAA